MTSKVNASGQADGLCATAIAVLRQAANSGKITEQKLSELKVCPSTAAYLVQSGDLLVKASGDVWMITALGRSAATVWARRCRQRSTLTSSPP